MGGVFYCVAALGLNDRNVGVRSSFTELGDLVEGQVAVNISRHAVDLASVFHVLLDGRQATGWKQQTPAQPKPGRRSRRHPDGSGSYGSRSTQQSSSALHVPGYPCTASNPAFPCVRRPCRRCRSSLLRSAGERPFWSAATATDELATDP